MAAQTLGVGSDHARRGCMMGTPYDTHTYTHTCAHTHAQGESREDFLEEGTLPSRDLHLPFHFSHIIFTKGGDW